MQRRTLETFEMLERDQQGVSTSNALLAVVNGMRTLPGRKSVIFFSEGVAIPANVAARFRSVIDTANRANVSIYAMDAAGLRTESTSKETRDSINAAAAEMLRRNPTTDQTGAPMTEALERNEDNLRRDPHSGLGQLADETGGILIRNTNDLTGGFRRIDQDMRNYYMLSYVPKNDTLDGKFRTIAVKVKRSGLDVAARKGYYAVPSTGKMPVLSFEAPALVLLERTPVPNAFPVRVAAVKFPEPGRPGLTPILVSVPASNLTFRQSDDKASYRAEFTILVRFKDASGNVADKLSQNYVLTGPSERLESVKQGNVLFYREPELAARRVLDGSDRPRRAGRAGERAVHDRRTEQSRRDHAARQQPRSRRQRRARGPVESARRQPVPRRRHAALSEHGRTGAQEHDVGNGILLHRVPSQGSEAGGAPRAAAERRGARQAAAAARRT